MIETSQKTHDFSGMNGIVAATGRDKRRVNDRLRDDRLRVVIAP